MTQGRVAAEQRFKGRLTWRRALKGCRSSGLCDQRFQSAWIVGAVCPERDDGVVLVLPNVSTAVTNLLLQEIARALPPRTHAVVVLDGAGWHTAEALAVPAAMTLLLLPPDSSELNPIEKLWRWLKDRYLSSRLYPTLDDVVDACCTAWNHLLQERGRQSGMIPRSL